MRSWERYAGEALGRPIGGGRDAVIYLAVQRSAGKHAVWPVGRGEVIRCEL